MYCEEFECKLTHKLVSEIFHYNFNLTNACVVWVDSVVNYFVKLGNFDENNDDIDQIRNNIFTNMNEDKELELFNWPDEVEANNIIKDALQEEPQHFQLIIESCGYSISPDNYFKAEWFFKHGIRQAIIDFINDYKE